MLRPEIKIMSLGLALFLLVVRLAFTKGEDESAEANTDVPIIRQINKMNDDGTYTYGYEAADGTFEIETRDLLGNVKDMFGFIDESGELKRVSYTANNESGFRNSIVHAPVATQTRPSTGSAARRPQPTLKNTLTLHSPTTKVPAIQHVTKQAQQNAAEEPSTTSADHVSVRRFPPYEKNHTEDAAKSHNSNPPRKILVSKRPTEEKDPSEKDGNSLRRQLNSASDLRGEMTRVYAGDDDNGFSANIPAHLSALLSELRPVQVVRATSPASVGYQTTADVESAAQEINEVPAPTHEQPYDSRKFGPSVAYVSARYRRPLPPPEEPPYTQHALIQCRHQNVPPAPQGIVPVSPTSEIPLTVPNYQTHPQHYYEPQPVPVIPPILRDEITAIIYNYLQVRLAPHPQHPYNPRYPYPPYTNPLLTPHYPHAPGNYALPPYVNPQPQYYPAYTNPTQFPVPTQTPAHQPSVRFSSRPEPPRRISPQRVQQTIRAATDDAHLQQTLPASPTRASTSQQKYSPTVQRLSNPKVDEPRRNLQIIAETTESQE